LKISGVSFARVNNANFVSFKNGKCLNGQLQNEKGAKIQLPSSNYEEYLKLLETNDIFSTIDVESRSLRLHLTTQS
jgi:hypothetical protein